MRARWRRRADVAAVAVALAVVSAGAGCLAQPVREDDLLAGAVDWLLRQRDGSGRWPAGLVPHMVEVAWAAGHDPQAWPPELPLADQFALPAADPEAPLLAQARALYAAALLGDADLAEEAVRRVHAAYDGDQFGDPRLLNDDVFALFVLAAADPAEPALAGALLGNQSTDGGWPWAVGGRGETDVTGMALTALAGTEPSALGLADTDGVRRFLESAQAGDGGYSLEPLGPANCDSTVWALRSSFLVDGIPREGPWAFLEGLRNGEGGYAYTEGGPSNALCTAEVAAYLGLWQHARRSEPWGREVV